MNFMGFLQFLLHTVLIFHAFLYSPHFSGLPVLKPKLYPSASVLTLPVKRLGAGDMPVLGAQAYIVIDPISGEVLTERNPDAVLPPASTTKIMTAMVVLEHMDLTSVITVDKKALSDGSVIHLVPGEKMRVKEMLEGMLIHSGNDAASELAFAYPGGTDAFIAAMNETAKSLHMYHTQYMNPTGLMQDGHVTTVRDLLILSRFAMSNPTFAGIVRIKEMDIASIDGKHVHHIGSTNALLGSIEGVEGIKTGWTEEAGECLVTQVTRQGHTVLIALLHSPDRFGETVELINWVFGSYHWETKPLGQW